VETLLSPWGEPLVFVREDSIEALLDESLDLFIGKLARVDPSFADAKPQVVARNPAAECDAELSIEKVEVAISPRGHAGFSVHGAPTGEGATTDDVGTRRPRCQGNSPRGARSLAASAICAVIARAMRAGRRIGRDPAAPLRERMPIRGAVG
jgi:hypothetical protein